jgi:hypothetical protein
MFRPIRPRTALAVALAIALPLAASSARAQFAAPPPDLPDLPVDAAFRAATVESLATDVELNYVFPDVGAKVARSLRDKLKRGRYDRITGAIAFNDSLNADLRAVAHDLHLRVHYFNRALPPQGAGDAPPSAEERARLLDQSRTRNFGFNRVERLAGNVGYLDLRAFEASPEAGEVAEAAMQFLAHTDALIVDLRRNGGGDPNMIVLILSHLYGEGERVHVNDFYERASGKTEEFWTSTSVPGPRFDGKDVYVLTSRRTGSAAEEFAYDIKNLKRGTLVGETTAGGANPGGFVRLNEHFVAFIAGGRAISPVTHTNWEGVGVEPDVKVPADEALKTAHVAALTTLRAKATDDERRASLDRALDAAKNAPVEALNLAGPVRVQAATQASAPGPGAH